MHILRVQWKNPVRHEVAIKSCDDIDVWWTSPPMLLGESTPLNKERGEQGSEAHNCAGFKA